MRFRLGDLQEEAAAYVAARDICKQLAADFSNQPEFLSGLARTIRNLGILFRAIDRTTDAEAAYGEALTITRQLVSNFPDNVDIRSDLTSPYNSWANVCNQQGNFAEAIDHLKQAEPHHQAVLNVNPLNQDYRELCSKHLSALTMANAGLRDRPR